MARIFSSLDRFLRDTFLRMLGKYSPEMAQEIRDKMLMFSDLAGVNDAGIQLFIKRFDRKVLALALKRADEAVRKRFMVDNMSRQAANTLQEEIDSLGEVKVKDADAAQHEILTYAKELYEKGSIRIG